MKRIPRGIYTQEFRAQAVSLHEVDGLTIPEAARYYAWRDRPLSARTQENARLEIEIRAAHQRTRETFGPERNFTVTAP